MMTNMRMCGHIEADSAKLAAYDPCVAREAPAKEEPMLPNP